MRVDTERTLAEQRTCREWLDEHRGEPGTRGAELGASDWCKEELLIIEGMGDNYKSFIQRKAQLGGMSGRANIGQVHGVLGALPAQGRKGRGGPHVGVRGER